MVKVKGYRVNEPRKPAEIRVCNCVHGHMNCNCDGKTGTKKLICIGRECNEFIYSKDFKTYRCEECYKIHCIEKEMLNESSINRD
tara:strand:+ start:85 stop:339 length:255 start_codon:yes stop_codon:yes gene_type:complete